MIGEEVRSVDDQPVGAHRHVNVGKRNFKQLSSLVPIFQKNLRVRMIFTKYRYRTYMFNAPNKC